MDRLKEGFQMRREKIEFPLLDNQYHGDYQIHF